MTNTFSINHISLLCFMMLLAMPSFSDERTVVSLFQSKAESHLGSISNSQVLKTTFSLHNPKSYKVVVDKIEASCGCTVVEGYQSDIPADQYSDVKIEIDMTGKRGEVSKELVITYRYQGEVHEMIYKVVFNAMSESASHTDGFLGEKLFGEECGLCHALPAKGKVGEELYEAVCASCHGSKGVGAYAIGFTTKQYLQRFDSQSAKLLIANGAADGFMPAFAAEQGGPLSEEQIDSLVNYLSSLKQRWKKFLRLEE